MLLCCAQKPVGNFDCQREINLPESVVKSAQPVKRVMKPTRRVIGRIWHSNVDDRTGLLIAKLLLRAQMKNYVGLLARCDPYALTPFRDTAPVRSTHGVLPLGE